MVPSNIPAEAPLLDAIERTPIGTQVRLLHVLEGRELIHFAKRMVLGHAEIEAIAVTSAPEIAIALPQQVEIYKPA